MFLENFLRVGPWSEFYFLVFTTLFLKQVNSENGIVYSPYVMENDEGPRSTSYTKDDVKVMLQLLSEQDYNVIATYGVGAPAEPYIPNSTLRNCFSVVHSAIAAAEINQERNHSTISLYQGLWLDSNDLMLHSEIEVGFEIAAKANAIYNGTVSSITFPSSAGFYTLFQQRTRQAIELVRARAQQQNLKFGVRLWDCEETIPKINKNDTNILNLLKSLDYIICGMTPTQRDFPTGQYHFAVLVIKKMTSVSKAIRENGLEIEIILETGWPGDASLYGANTVEEMIQFRNHTRIWSKQTNQKMFLFEGFNSPRKINQVEDLAAYYGVFKHLQTSDNSRSAYVLKKAEAIDELEILKKFPQSGISEGRVSWKFIVGVTLGLVLFTLVVIVITCTYSKITHFRSLNKLSDEYIRDFLVGSSTKVDEDKLCNDGIWRRAPYNTDLELIRGQFSIDKNKLLGKGTFGSVYKGNIGGAKHPVAFKMTREDCPVTALKGLLSEIKILAYLGRHDNLVSICGAYTDEVKDGILYVATEFCVNGSLEVYLRAGGKHQYSNLSGNVPLDGEDITDSQLLQWSLEIASGMEYISSKNVIHADLAARNVLLTENLTAKVADFGLSRRLYEYTEYVKKQQEPLPWRWMAFESLTKLEFSTNSDVWSYGVTIWEIFSLGAIPYPGLSWDINFTQRLEQQLRLCRPSRCPLNIYEIITSCWNLDPSCRPCFHKLKTLFEGNE